jgi:hypothetical protein
MLPTDKVRGRFPFATLRCALVLLLAICSCPLAGCGKVWDTSRGQTPPPLPSEVRKLSKSAPPVVNQARAPYAAPARIAKLEDKSVNESSGVVASRRNRGLFWTHNDSGDGPNLYAFDREGRKRGVWRVEGAQAVDWEDIAAGPGPEPGRAYLYVGDTGDNDRAREQVTVYRVPEPQVSDADAASDRKNPRPTEAAEAIRLKYPDGRHDAETLLVHPRTADIYVVTKSPAVAGVYKLAAPYSTKQVNTLALVTELRVPALFAGLLTGGDISPDGTRVVLCDYLAAYELTLPAAAPAGGFDAVWKQTPLAIDLGEREQGEGICYGEDGSSVLATSEKRPTPLIEVKRHK